MARSRTSATCQRRGIRDRSEAASTSSPAWSSASILFPDGSTSRKVGWSNAGGLRRRYRACARWAMRGLVSEMMMCWYLAWT
jgi:hypothetical protein